MTSISAERSGLAKVGHSLRRREQWDARRSYTDARTVTEPATRVFVHITVTNPDSYGSNDAHARAIEAIGISRFPSTGISYNRLIMPDATAYEAQPIGRRGAHTVNDFKRSTCSTSGCPGRGSSITAPDWNLNYNARAYAICQNVQNTVTEAMVDTLARCIAADKLAGFVTRGASIHGHRCVSAKSCPGDRMWARMGELEKRVNHYLTNGLNGDDDMPLNDADKKWIEARLDANAATTLSGLLNHRNPYGHVAPSDNGKKPTLETEWGRIDVRTYRMEQILAQPAVLAAALAPLLAGGGSPSQADLEAALRSVLGSLDE